MKRIGIDIGTTTVCISVAGENNRVLSSAAMKNTSRIGAKNDFESLQDADAILEICIRLIDSAKTQYPDAVSIGVTGQMHGILYVDDSGKAVSPLFGWQDGRGDLPFSRGTYASYVSEACGRPVSTGYGITTHFHNAMNGLVPGNASKICTVPDYVAMRLCSLSSPVMHPSMAASVGCFDLQRGIFDLTAVERLGLDAGILPEIVSSPAVIGEYCGMSVRCAIGDNQASFLGSGADESSILVNVGTGAQICVAGKGTEINGIEIRPYLNGDFITVGASLSGGSAYAMLEKFFSGVAGLAGAGCESLYSAMDKALEQYGKTPTLKVDTRFCGTRADPSVRGAITNISPENFTPEQLMLGFTDGIAEELYSMYEYMPSGQTRLIGSGNGMRRNKALRRSVEKIFGMTVDLVGNEEEAAYGAAILQAKE
ncbi:MAG: hypothetical protein IJU75_02200 [Clostridia bacterium]|nr:hypothetical protein [Clostridia bacterium]